MTGWEAPRFLQISRERLLCLSRLRNRSPVFWFTRVSYVRDGPPVEYVKSTYRGDRYRIVNRLTRLEM